MLMEFLTVPMGIISSMADLVPITVNQFEVLRPDRFISDHYLDKLAYTHHGINEINGFSALSYKQGVIVQCVDTRTRSLFMLGG